MLAGFAAASLVIAACSSGGVTKSGDSSSPAGAATHAGGLKSFKVASVPSYDNAPLTYAKDHGYYKQAGLDVTFSDVDAGPTIVTGVINGTYDAGTAAAFPLLIAAAKGAPLKIAMGIDTVGPDLGNSALVVPAKSPIRSYKDLDGKTIATNALTSLTTLATKIAVDRAGGNAKNMKFISLPFKSAVQAAARGQVAAAVVISPFGTQAAINGMRTIGDPIGTMMPRGSSYGLLFTSAKTAKAKAGELTAFRKATERAMQKLSNDPALQRKLAQTEGGLSAKVAAKQQLPGYTTTISPSAMQKYAELVAKYGYTDKPVDVKALILQ